MDFSKITIDVKFWHFEKCNESISLHDLIKCKERKFNFSLIKYRLFDRKHFCDIIFHSCKKINCSNYEMLFLISQSLSNLVIYINENFN